MLPLEKLFNPSSVAVFGASAKPGKLGNALVSNILSYGFKGKVYPLNPTGGEVGGLSIYPSLKEVQNPIDLAVISIPSHQVPGAVQECVEQNVKVAVILSSGFGEAGEKGKKVQEEVRRIASQGGLRLVGPNCMGVYNLSEAFNATYFWELPKIEGNISFISQSGAFGGLFFQQVRQRKFGIAKFISIGNMVDIDYVELLEYLGRDPKTGVIALFIEGLQDGKQFVQKAAEITRLKPIVVLKGGRTEAGAKAAASHTGSMAGMAALYETAFRQAGIVWANSSEEFFDQTIALSSYGEALPKSRKLAIITISGGPSVVASDTCEEQGLQIAPLAESTGEKVRELIPDFGASGNPVDMTPQCDPERYGEVVATVMGDDNVDGIVAINVGLDRPQFAQAFVDGIRHHTGKPVVAFTSDTPQISELFLKHNVPNFLSVEGAVRGYHSLVKYRELKERMTSPFGTIPEGLTVSRVLNKTWGPGVLDEYTSKLFLQEYGIPTCREAKVSKLREAQVAAREIGYPVALKVCGSQYTHKSQLGGVVLNIADESSLADHWHTLAGKFGAGTEFLVQEMVDSPKGTHELIIGAKHDAAFGPFLVFGLGGIAVELMKEFAIKLLPIDRPAAFQFLMETRAYQLLAGYRGSEPVDLSALADILVKVSNLMVANPSIKELDINPLLALPGRLVAVDGLVVLG
ncbi:MAG: acetate--CoA ligase family protein [Carboxydocellales bacterium]